MESPRNRVDLAIITFSAFILIGSLYLQFNESLLDEAFLSSNAKVLGQVSEVTNDVRRRLQMDLSWGSLSESRRIYEGDSVFTGVDSKVRIELHQGDFIEIDEQSLIVVRTGAEGLELNLAYGGFSGVLTSNQNIVLRDGEKSQSLKTENSEIRVTRSKRTKPRIQVLSGSVDLIDTQTQKVVQTITQATTPVEEKSTIEETPQPLEWVTPESRQIIFRDLNPKIKDPEIEFKWKDLLVHPLYQLQVATDSEFQNLVIDTKTKETRFSTLQLQNASTYYSRVRPLINENPAAAWSQVQSFVIDHFHSFEISKVPTYVFTVPFSHSVLTSQNQPFLKTGIPWPKMKNMTWEKIASTTDYEIEISDHPEFLNSTKHKVTNSNQFQLQLLQPQDIYWRVKPLLQSQNEVPHLQGDHWKVQLSPPRLKSSNQAQGQIELSWNQLLFASSYELQFSTTKTFIKPRSLMTTALKLSPSVKDDPSGYWRIRALNSNQKAISDFSEILEVKIPANDPAPSLTLASQSPAPLSTLQILGPSLLEPRNKANIIALGDSKVFLNFKWMPVASFVKFEFEISEDPNFAKKMVSGFVKRPMYFMKAHELKPGTYFWRVRMLTTDATSDWSQVNEFTLR